MDGSYGVFRGAVERRRFVAIIALVVSLAGAGVLSMTGPADAQTAAAANPAPIRLAVLGDSLTAGYGLSAKAAFPARLQKALAEKGRVVEIVNAGVSGDTASGGRDRLDWSIPAGTQAVLVELGANDALRGLDPKITRAALADIVKRLQAKGIAVMLCGMYAPRNYGPDYVARFDAIYPELAKTFNVPLYPFFLEGVAGDARLNQPDRVHPTADGIDVIVKRILPTVESFLGTLPAQRS